MQQQLGKVVNAIKFKTWMYWTFCNYTWVISGQYVGHLVASVLLPLIEFLLWLQAMTGNAKQVTCCVFQPYLGHNLGWEKARIILLHKGNKKWILSCRCLMHCQTDGGSLLYGFTLSFISTYTKDKTNLICWILNITIICMFL